MAMTKPSSTFASATSASGSKAFWGTRMTADLQAVIERAWDEREGLGPETKGDVRCAVDAAIAALDRGEARIAEQDGREWTVHQWLKKAVLLSFRLYPMEAIAGGPGGAHWWD